MAAHALERLWPRWLRALRARVRHDVSIIGRCIRRDACNASLRLTPLEKMVVLLEDRRFFHHIGVDLRSVIRELYKMLTLRKHGGASTIDMQFVRTATDYRDHTLERKAYESLLAILIHFRYGKHLILRSYLAFAYFGTGLHNADRAAQKVFAKTADQLDLEEAAFLASLLAYPRPRSGSAEWERKARRRAAYAMEIYRSKAVRLLNIDPPERVREPGTVVPVPCPADRIELSNSGPPRQIGPRIRGYAGTPSVEQGGRLQLHLSNVGGSPIPHVPIRIIRFSATEVAMHADFVDIPAQPIPAERAWENNRWDSCYAVDVGFEWPSGIYAARVGKDHDDTIDLHFIVKSSAPGSGSRIVVQMPTTTINAYNNWGGASLYDYNSRPQRASAVSFGRPQQADPAWSGGYGFEKEWEYRLKAFVQWLEIAGYTADFISNTDLHDGYPLNAYRLFVSVGHDEYWTQEMRRNFDNFIAAGGNAAVFGGNTCYWQIRLEQEIEVKTCRQQVCFKEAAQDPFPDPRRKTVTWRTAGYPENVSFGAGFYAGAWRGSREFGAYKVCRPHHWVFSRTGLARDDKFGHTPEEELLGYETNGVDYVLDREGLPVPSGIDGTPKDFAILALADLPHWETPGNAAMGILTRSDGGGTIFNAATTDWAKGLEACVKVGDPSQTLTGKITLNVIQHLLHHEVR
jgi:hypothetical protein